MVFWVLVHDRRLANTRSLRNYPLRNSSTLKLPANWESDLNLQVASSKAPVTKSAQAAKTRVMEARKQTLPRAIGEIEKRSSKAGNRQCRSRHGVVLGTKGKEIHYGLEIRLNFTLANSVEMSATARASIP